MPTDLIPDIVQAIQNGQSWMAYILVVAFGLGVFSLPQARHPRNRKSVLNAFAWLFLILVLYFETKISAFVFLLICCIAILSIGLGFWSAYKPLFWENTAFKLYENWLLKMRYNRLDGALQRKPWYICTHAAQIKWQKIYAKYLYQKKKFYKSLDACRHAENNFPLLEQEMSWFVSNQMFCLWNLGHTERAKNELYDKKRLIPKDTFYYLQGLIQERQGNLEQSKDSLLMALDNVPKKNDWKKGYLYNDIGRIQGILGNTTERLHYTEKSAQIAFDFEDKFLGHISIPNLMESALLVQEQDKAWKWFEVYKSLDDDGELHQRLETLNCQLNLARQIDDREWLLNILEWGEQSIRPAKMCAEKAIFDKSTLRIRYHNNAGWEHKLSEIRNNLDSYLQLDFPVDHEFVKEIWGIIRDLAVRGIMSPQRKSDNAFMNKIFEFRKASWDKIEAHKFSLPDECVFEWCYWEGELAELRKSVIENASLEEEFEILQKILDHLKNISDIHKERGNAIEAFQKHLHIADESMHYSIQSRLPKASSFFCDNCQEYTDIAANEIAKFSKHPDVLHAMLVLAKLYLFLGNKEKANGFFQIFNDSQLRLDHLAQWLRKYYYEVRNILQGTDTIRQTLLQNQRLS